METAWAICVASSLGEQGRKVAKQEHEREEAATRWRETGIADSQRYVQAGDGSHDEHGGRGLAEWVHGANQSKQHRGEKAIGGAGRNGVPLRNIELTLFRAQEIQSPLN